MDVYVKTLTGFTMKLRVEAPEEQEFSTFTEIIWECKECKQEFDTRFFKEIDIPTHCPDCTKKLGITDFIWTGFTEVKT